MNPESVNLTALRDADAERMLKATEQAEAYRKSRKRKARRRKAQRQEAYGPPTDPNALAYRIPAAIVISGFSRSELYRRLNTNELVGRKSGRSLLIDGDSLRRCVAGLPIAKFGAEKSAA